MGRRGGAIVLRWAAVLCLACSVVLNYLWVSPTALRLVGVLTWAYPCEDQRWLPGVVVTGYLLVMVLGLGAALSAVYLVVKEQQRWGKMIAAVLVLLALGWTSVMVIGFVIEMVPPVQDYLALPACDTNAPLSHDPTSTAHG